MSRPQSQKPRPAILATSVAALLSLGMLLSVPAARADEYWDGTNTAGSNQANGAGGDGSWTTTNTNWVDQTGNNPTVYDSSQIAHFATTPGKITIDDGAISFTELNFDVSGYTVQAGTATTINALAGSKISIGSGSTVTFSTANISGADVTFTGGGTVILQTTVANTNTGTTIDAGTTLSISNGNQLGNGSLTFSGNEGSSATGNTLLLTSPVTVTQAINLTGSGTINSSSNSSTLSGVIAGAGKLTLSGGGTYTLSSGGNTFTGGLDIGTQTTVSVDSDAELGDAAGALIFDGGTLLVTTTFATPSTRPITLDTGNGTISTGSGVTATFNGVISAGPSSGTSNGGALLLSGSGTVVLGGVNTYTAGTDIGTGTTLSISNDGNLGAAGGAVVFDGGTLITTADITTTRPVTLDSISFGSGAGSTGGALAPASGTTLMMTGVVSGTGELFVSGAGVVVLGGTNTYQGGTDLLLGSTLSISSDSNLGNAAGNLMFDGGTLITTGDVTSSRFVNLNTATATVEPASGTTLTFNGIVSNGSGTKGSLVMNGAGTLVLGGANIYTGSTTVDSGTLNANATNTIPKTSALVLASGTTFNLKGFSQNIGSLADATAGATSTVNLGSATLTVGNDNTSTTFSGAIHDGGAAGGLTKVGSGTLTLAGTSDYIGTTAVNGGTLDLTGALSSDSELAVGGGTFELGTASQTLNGLAVTKGASEITVTTAGGTLNLSGTTGHEGITRVAGGFVDFTPGSGVIKTNQKNDASGIIGAWATVNGGAALASVNGAGDIVAYTGYVTVPNQFAYIPNAPGANIEITSSLVNPLPIQLATTDINTLTQSSGASETVSMRDLANGVGTLRLGQTGAIFIAPAGGSLTIGQLPGFGTLTAGGPSANTAGDLLLENNNTASTLTINSVIANNGSGTLNLFINGTGTTVLATANTYTGSTSIFGGTLQTNATGAIPAGSSVLIDASGTLNLNDNSQTVSSISDGPNGGGKITLGTAAATTLTVGSTNQNSSFTGLISGAGQLIKNGSGTLVLSNTANSYTGGTTLNSGTLIVNGDPANGTGTPLGAGTLTINGGTLATTLLPTSGVGTGTVISNNIVLGGNFSIAPNSDPANAGAQNITLNGNIDLHGGSRTITGIVDQGQVHFGAGGAIIDSVGGGGLTLSTSFTGSGNYVAFIMDNGHTNTYSGLTTIKNGAFLVLEGTSGAPVIQGNVDIEGNGVVDYLGSGQNQLASTAIVTDNSTGNTASGIFFGGLDLFNAAAGSAASPSQTITTLNGHGTVVLGAATLGIKNGVFTGNMGDGSHTDGNGNAIAGGGIVKLNDGTASGGTLTLGGQNFYTGATTVSGGTLLTTISGALPQNSAVTVASGATLDIDSFNQFIGSLTGAGTVNLGSASLVTGFDNSSTNFSGTFNDGGLSKGKGGNLVKVGTGTMTLTSTNNYTGETFVSAGGLVFSGASLIPTMSQVFVSSTGFLDLSNVNQTVGSISDGSGGGTINIGSTTLTTGGNDKSSFFDGIIEGSGGNLVKNGRGTFFLDGANTYTGTTTVNAGTLDLGGSLESPVTVNGSTFIMDKSAAINPISSSTLPVTLTKNSIFDNFANLTTTAAQGVTLTDTGNTVAVQQGGTVSGLQGIVLTNPANALEIVNFGTITGTDKSSGTATAIDASKVDYFTYGDFGTINGQVKFSPKNNIILLATGFSGPALAGPKGAVNTLRLTGGATDTVNQNNFPNYQFLDKVGGGLWNVIGANTYTGGANIETGTINLQGMINANTVIQSAGALTGFGTLTGNLFNQGLVAPGNGTGVMFPTTTIGTLTIKGNYTQAPGGQLVIQVAGNRPGQADLLSISGHATLGGTLVLQPTKSKTLTLAMGQTIPILTASGGITGRFGIIDNLFNTDTLIVPTIGYLANSVVIEGTQGSFQSLARTQVLTPNQLSVAKALDSVVNNNAATKLIGYLDSRPLEKLPNDLDRIAPEELGSIFRLGVSLSQAQSAGIMRRTSDIREGTSGFTAAGFETTGDAMKMPDGLAGPNGAGDTNMTAPIPERKWGSYITGTGDFIHVGSTDNAQGYNLDSGGVTVGADYKFNEHFAVGVNAGYSGTNSGIGDGGRLVVNSGKTAVYGSYWQKGFYGDAAVGGGINGYNIRRSALQGDARGSTQGKELDTLVNAGYDWRIDALTIGPTASFEYTYLGMDAYTERGSLAPLRYPTQHNDSLRLTLGIKASYDLKVGNVLVRPEAQVAWQREFGDRAATIDSSIDTGPGNLFRVTDTDIGRDSLLLSGGVAVMWNPRTSTYIYYDADILRKEYNSQSVTGGLKVNF